MTGSGFCLHEWVVENSTFQTWTGFEYLEARCCLCGMHKLMDAGRAPVRDRSSRKPVTAAERKRREMAVFD